MRRVSLKRQRQNRAERKTRSAFLVEQSRCWHCRFRPATDVHEITRGPLRALSTGRRECWLALCRLCHDHVGTWPAPKQLALKKFWDPDWYSLDAINEIRRGSHGMISAEEVEKEFSELRLVYA